MFLKKMSLANIFILLFIVYLMITLGLYIFQRKLLYYPFLSPTSNHSVTGDGLVHDFETINVRTKDNIDLKGWFHLKGLEKKTLLFFHGNASNLDNRIFKLNLLGNLDINFLIISWRGYSGNLGKPSELGLYKDAEGALEWLNKKGIPNNQIILYGESLGAAVAIEIGQSKNFGGIILESPFTSMVDMGRKSYPIFPVKFLLKDKYETKKKIKNIKFPILVMHGKKDKLVPFYMGEEIYHLANMPKSKYFTEEEDHMMEFDKNLVDAISEFLKSLN